MRTLNFACRNFWRDLKSGESWVLFLAMAVAVLSLTAVGFFTSRVSLAVQRQANEVLAADLRIESGRPLSAAYLREAQSLGLRTAQVVSFPTAVFAGEATQLASVHAVTATYPLRGTVRIADAPFAPARSTTATPAPGEAWADARLVATLGVAVGTPLQLGASQLRITAILDYRPDQGSSFVNLAPALLIDRQSLDATQLLLPGSRATYAALFAGSAGGIAALREWLAIHKAHGDRVQEIDESSRQLNSAVTRANRFLNLASLASVLLAAVAVAMGARSYMRSHIDSVALLKCLGASQRFVLSVALIELVFLSLGAVLIGALLGFGAATGLAWLAKGFIQTELPAPSLYPVPIALVTVLAMLLGFALPPLWQLKNTPPLRVLRQVSVAPPLRYGLVYLLAAGALFAILWLLVRDVELVLTLFAGVAGLGLALGAAGWLLVSATSRLRGAVGVAWRYGLANVARRGRDSIVQIIAFGLGIMLLLLLAVVRGDLLADWRNSLPKDAPNHFLINIPAERREELRSFLQGAGLPNPQLFPMVRARIVAINGRPIGSRKFAEQRGQAFAEREQNLTWAAELPQDNEITAGAWWPSAMSDRHRVSISAEYAQSLQLGIGDRLSFDLAGEALHVKVASIRKVRWDGFRPNFFLVFPPGLIDAAAGTYMTSLYLHAQQRQQLAELVHRFPSVSVIDVEAILGQIRVVMDRASLAVQFVFVFTLLAGIVVLLAAVQATREERRYESAVLRSLGASRKTVLQGVAAEFAALGFLSGGVGAIGASVAGWVIAQRLLSLSYTFSFGVWAIGLFCGTLFVGIAGTLAARRVVNTAPMDTLRSG
jgi:putative ABC transport system permease protein